MAPPYYLQAYDRWILWSSFSNKKLPVTPDLVVMKKGESWNKPESWLTYESALERLPDDPAFGLGFVLTPDTGVLAIDVDDMKFYRHFKWPTYREHSPSGRGRHIFCNVNNITVSRNLGGLEFYTHNRWISVTGKCCSTTKDMTDCTPHALRAFKRFLPPPVKKVAQPGSSTAISAVYVLSELYRNPRAIPLFQGFTQNYRSASQADIALCHMIAFWAGPNPAVIDQVFRKSKLMRDKWDELRGDMTYGEITIANTLATQTSYKDM